MMQLLHKYSYRLWWAIVLVFGLIYPPIYLLPGMAKLGGTLGTLATKYPIAIGAGFFAAWLLSVGAIYYLINNAPQSAGGRVKSLVRKINWDYVAVGICAVILVGGVVLANKRHLDLRTGLFDFALEQQVVWNTSQGRPFAASVEVNNYLGDHFSLITLPVSLVYKIFPSTLTLFILQTGAVAIAAFGIYLLAKKILQSPAWAMLTLLLFSCYWGIYGLVMFDYHPVVFALPLMIFGIYFAIYGNKKQQWWGYFLLVLATLAKEDMGIFVGSLGIYLALIKKDKRGWALMVYSYIIAVVALMVIIPAFRGVASDTLSRYIHIGMPVGEIVGILVNQQHITYLVRMLAPLLLLPLLAPAALLTILPSVAINYLANYEGQLSLINHYDVATTVGVFWAMILAVALLRKLKAEKLLGLIVGGLVLVNVAILPGHPLVRDFKSYPERREVYEQLAEIRPLIPNDAVLMATNRIGAHFGEREQLQVLDPGYRVYAQLPDFILVDTVDGESAVHVQQQLTKLFSQANYGLVVSSDKLKLYQRFDK